MSIRWVYNLMIQMVITSKMLRVAASRYRPNLSLHFFS